MSIEPRVDDITVPEAEAPEAPLDAVVIVKTVDADGNVGTDVVLNGSVTPLEAATLIKLGARAWDQKLGF